LRYILKDLDCAACTAKIEAELRNINGLENTNVNFATQSVELPEELFATAQEVVSRVEPGVRLVPFSEPTAAAMEKDEKRPPSTHDLSNSHLRRWTSLSFSLTEHSILLGRVLGLS
jgi:cation transport ATPase